MMSWISDNIPQDIADYVFNVVIVFSDKSINTFVRNTKDDFVFDFDDLEKQLIDTPQMIAFYDVLLAEQKVKVAMIKRMVDSQKGRIVEEILKRSKEEDIKLRRDDVDDIINSDVRYNELSEKVIVEVGKEEKLKSVVNALRAKNDNLRSLAGFKRDEKQNSGR